MADRAAVEQQAELVGVDGVAVPGRAGRRAPALVAVVAVPAAARQRLSAAGAVTVTDELDEVGGADVVLVSTRLSRAEVGTTMSAVAARARCPVVALVHTGGEGLAVELFRLGAAAVLAEGNEAALSALLAGQSHDTSLVETYDRKQSRARGGADGARSRDEVSGLPRAQAFDQQLVELEQAGAVPRVAFVRIVHLADAIARVAPAAAELLRRRLALQFRQIARAFDVELYTISETELGMIGTRLSPQQAEQLGNAMAEVAAMYAPAGNTPLALALGHAGAEVTSEVSALRGLAQRALVVALAQPDNAIVGADALALGVSSTTELEAAERLLDDVEQHDGHAPGHGARVAELVAELAWELGYDGLQRVRVRFAAHLHDIGKAGLRPAAMAWSQQLDGDLLEAYRSHPVRGADFLRVSAGTDVADAVRHHHERWDGAGFPDGLAGEAIPLAARIIAVADRFDRYRCDPVREDGQARSLADALARLERDAGDVLDPSLVATAVTVFPRVDASRLARDGVGRPAAAGHRPALPAV